jgi:hypothetical protein
MSSGDPMQMRTPEEHAAIRRRTLPVAAVGAVLGLVGALLPFSVVIDAYTPPNIFAVNLAFCAIMMGAGILLYAKGTSGTTIARGLSAAALILGIAGTLIFAKQSAELRGDKERTETAHVQAVAKAAAAYARKHDGVYPADLVVLLESGELEPQTLKSPFGQRNPIFDHFQDVQKGHSHEEVLKTVENATDYLYLGGDLKNVPKDLEKDIIVAASQTVILRVSLAVSMVDGSTRFITLDDVPEVRKACNDARHKLGLPDMPDPPAVKEALEEAKAEATRPK